MDLTTLVLFQVLNGLVWGLVIALIALGLALIFGIMEVINVAHGSLYMLGAVLAWYVLGATGASPSPCCCARPRWGRCRWRWSAWCCRPIENEKVLTIIATTGVMLVLQHSVLATFGGGVQRIAEPHAGRRAHPGLHYPVYRLVVAAPRWRRSGAVALPHPDALWPVAARGAPGRQDGHGARHPVGRVYMLAVGLGGPWPGSAACSPRRSS